MKVKVYITFDVAVTAISYHLRYEDEKILKKNFSRIISDYISLFGESSIDDHDSEIPEFIQLQAEKIVKKYYRF